MTERIPEVLAMCTSPRIDPGNRNDYDAIIIEEKPKGYHKEFMSLPPTQNSAEWSIKILHGLEPYPRNLCNAPSIKRVTYVIRYSIFQISSMVQRDFVRSVHPT
jgi:hypothetical protein